MAAPVLAGNRCPGCGGKLSLFLVGLCGRCEPNPDDREREERDRYECRVDESAGLDTSGAA